jgi:cyanate lyase
MMDLKYHNIKKEIKDLGLNNKKVAALLGISVQGLDYRIKEDKPTIHWAMYGISNYYGEPDNLTINEKV